MPNQPTLESIPQKIQVIAHAMHKESKGKVLTDRYQQQVSFAAVAHAGAAACRMLYPA
ncbi:MAG: hypothetical protein ACSLEN_08710 [Candidatus Malihini olakiniferum]